MAGEVNSENLLGTPAGYATPAQLASVYEMAKALQSQSMQPVRHWTQGLSHVVEALVGGAQARGADVAGQRAREEQARVIGEYVRDAGGLPSAAPAAAPSPAAPSARAASFAEEPSPGTAPVDPPAKFSDRLPATSVPGATPVRAVPVKPDPYGLSGAMGWEETDPATGQRTGGGTFAPSEPALPFDAASPAPGVVPGMPQLPPGAAATVRALADPTGGRAGAPQASPPAENAALAKMLAGVIRAGGDWREALGLVNARQAFLPKYDVDPYGREVMTMPGRPPQLTGRQMRPGRETKIGELPAYETIGPDGRPVISMPRFEDQGAPGAVPSGSPQGTPSAAGGVALPRNAREAIEFPGKMKGFAAGQEELAKEQAKGVMKPVNEAIDRGGQKAQDVIQVLDRIENAYDVIERAGGNIAGGPARAAVLSLQQFANQLATAAGRPPPFRPDEVAAPEVIKKSTAELALKQIKEASSRGGTQREFIAMLDNNPGIALSDAGSRYMTNILRQQVKLDQRVGELASSDEIQANPRAWNQTLTKFYDTPENRIVSPFTGKPLVGDAVRADEVILKRAAAAAPRPGGPLAEPPPGAANAEPVRVQTPQEAEKLAPGTRYVAPDGKVRVR